RRAADQAVRHCRSGRRPGRVPVLGRRGADHRRKSFDRRRLDRAIDGGGRQRTATRKIAMASLISRLSAVVRRPSSDGKKRINLALQGGGAHGAFTWGVLDHLLEDGRFAISGISGTSAGAMNAVMLADGLARGGPEEARKRLAEFWRAASIDGDLPGVQRTVIDRLFSFLPYETSPAQLWFNALSRFLSPYDLNPLNINP